VDTTGVEPAWTGPGHDSRFGIRLENARQSLPLYDGPFPGARTCIRNLARTRLGPPPVLPGPPFTKSFSVTATLLANVPLVNIIATRVPATAWHAYFSRKRLL